MILHPEGVQRTSQNERHVVALIGGLVLTSFRVSGSATPQCRKNQSFVYRKLFDLPDLKGHGNEGQINHVTFHRNLFIIKMEH